MKPVAAAIASVLLASGALAAQEEADPSAPSKRAEGRYFFEMAEVMVNTSDFDLALGSITPTGARAGQPVEQLVADLSHPKASPPRITLGLNRPGRNGAASKTSIEFWIFDMHLKDTRIPENLDAQDQVVETDLLPPGVVFQRQQPLQPDNEVSTDFVPNYGNEFGYIRRAEYRSGGVTVAHTFYENMRTRVRWVGGIKYAELDQKLSARMSFTPEQVADNFDTQDFLSVQSKANTHGFGPNFGLDGRLILDKKKKKWSIEARGEVAMIPESTSAQYSLSLVDTSGEVIVNRFEDPPGTIQIFIENVTERPIMPGLGSPQQGDDAFNAFVRQQDFTEPTWLAEGRIGLKWQASRYCTLGIDAWGMHWGDLISDVGLINTIHESATYEQLRAADRVTDPQLEDVESVIHVPRFSKREDYSFTGVSLSLKFDF